ncbi:MAG: hypothetical protein HY736_27855 [Verrucomicrobia bacterium]|nr:hypothetical protein [Verrucomicrobiota bacterium]
MLSTTARPITRHEYALIPVGAPNFQLTENADTPAATYRAKQQFTSTLLPGLTIDLAAVFAL